MVTALDSVSRGLGHCVCSWVRHYSRNVSLHASKQTGTGEFEGPVSPLPNSIW